MRPGEGRAVVAGLRGVGVQNLSEAVRPRIRHRGDRGRDHYRNGGPAEIHQRQDQDGEHGHLDFLRFDLFADILRRAAHHQARDEDRDDDEEQHAVHAGSDAADDDFAELNVDQRNHATKGGERVVHCVDGAARGRRRDDREERRGDNAESNFLALHVAAGEAERGEGVVAVSFRPVADDHAGDEENAHHRQNGPSLALIADHPAEHVGERGAEREDRDHLDEIRQRGRVLERMRSIGVEEAAAIGAEHLDRDLGGNRAHGNGLLGAFQRCRINIRPKCLRHTLPHQKQGIRNADRNENVERATGHIDPEIADGSCGGTREAANERDCEHNASRCGKKILVGQAEHLHEVGQRAFAAVVLPVGVGDEADRRIE